MIALALWLVLMAFDPVSLFGSGEEGVIYDCSDLSTLFQDAAGTIPAAVDSPVGRVTDLSGNGRHALQATAGKRPILRHDFSGYYLAFDGVDDFLNAVFAITQPVTRVSVCSFSDYTNTHVLYSGNGSTGYLQQHGGDPAYTYLEIYAGAFSGINTDYRMRLNDVCLVTEVFNGANSTLFINQDTTTAGNAGSDNFAGLTIGGHPVDLYTPMHFYRLIEIDRVLTAPEIEDSQWWLTRDRTRVLVVDGDSNSWSMLAFPGVALPALTLPTFLQLIAYTGTGLQTNIPNDLTTPARLVDIDARIPTNKRGRQYVYFAYWSNNGDADSPEEVAAFLADRKAAGWDAVGIFTWYERTDPGQSNVGYRHPFNNTVTAGTWVADHQIDFLVNFGADPILGADGMSTNPTYCVDGVHLTTAGTAIAASIFADTINGLAGPMANLDSRSKRSSSVNLWKPYIAALVLPDGTIDQGDRQQSVWDYSGILGAAPAGGGGVSVWGFGLGTWYGAMAPANMGRAITPSNTVNYDGSTYSANPAGSYKPIPADGIYVGGAGVVVAVLENGATASFTAVAGEVLPVKTIRVNSTNTTATLLVALYVA